ncbi:hypothetical protein [Methanobacterium sp. CWC-01]|nr:hypothetical protein [Methanobacterium sp. CWC-01]
MGRKVEMLSKGIIIRPFGLEDVNFIIAGQLELYERGMALPPTSGKSI